MKRRLFYTYFGAYLLFLAAGSFAAFFLTPRLLRHFLYAISAEEDYRRFLASQAIAIQNFCYLFFFLILLLSLIPGIVFFFRIYRPLSKIVQEASQLTDDQSHPPINYHRDDELGRLTAAINCLAETVHDSGEYQRKFISNISHDFRSPLTSIKGYVEAMLDGTIPPSMQEKYLGIVVSETERLNKLTEGLLTLNTFDDRGVYLELADFDLIPVIENTVTAQEGLLSRKSLHVETSFPPGSVTVNADLVKIQQVLYNLLDNAIKFSYNDGIIQISVSIRKKLVFVSIKDFGEGIASENLPKIWDRFYKTDTSRGRDKKGTGLGLSIVREIIRAHNQNINVISTQGVGTEFVFSLNHVQA